MIPLPLRSWPKTALSLLGFIAGTARAEVPPVTAPPESFFELVSPKHRDAAREFYKKCIDVKGLPAVAAGVVEDRALQRTHEIVTHMLAGRPDVMKAFRETGMYLIIIGRDQGYTDMPENRLARNPAYLNERVRGTGGRPTSFGEENLLSLPIDRYDDESIAVHEFAHTIDSTLRGLEADWSRRVNETFRAARKNHLYDRVYAGSNATEYWAEIVQAYFDCNRVNNWNHGPVGTREQLKVHDPAGYELVRKAFNLSPDQDWRYHWLQSLPNVIAPPARFQCDPYYTKFTYARELPVIGRKASDAALLKANDTVRKMFAYRHDLLKALIDDGVKLAVLGKEERLADLPETRLLSGRDDFDPLARTLDYTAEAKLLVVAEENVLADPARGGVGDYQVIAGLARAIHAVVGTRPVAPEEEGNRELQQYEIGVKRLDQRFAEQLQARFAEAQAAGKWQGTAAVHNAGQYWVQGVLAYFQAAGQEMAPTDLTEPITTRERLKAYDSGLWGLINETMAFDGRVEWRFTPAASAK